MKYNPHSLNFGPQIKIRLLQKKIYIDTHVLSKNCDCLLIYGNIGM